MAGSPPFFVFEGRNSGSSPAA